MKRLLLTNCFMVLVIVGTMAANRLYIEDFSIAAGETRQLAVLMDNDIAFTGFQFDLVLPEGMSIETKANGDPKVTINTARADDHQTVTYFRDDGRISILLMSLASTEIMGNSGAVLFFNVTTSSDFGGVHQISIINAEMTTEAGVSVKPENTYCTVTGPANGEDPEIPIGRLYMDDFTINAGQTKQVALMMDNETPFTGFQFDMMLPEGLAIETKSNGDPKVTINTDRADDHQTVTNFRDDGRISILMMSLNSTEILGTSGAVLYFNLTASETFNGNHQIVIKNIEMTSPDGIAINPVDTFCTVTGIGGVNPPVESIELNTTMAKLPLGKTLQLNANSAEVTWSSSDLNVATVDENGLVTAISDGMVAITATAANGTSAWCAIWCYLRGDVNENGETDISDVTLLINYLLKGTWPEDNVQPDTPTSDDSVVYTVNGVSFTMVPVKGGTFSMGATVETDSNASEIESPVHDVTLSNYYIGQTEVTQELWQAVMGSNPSHYTGDLQHPVENVNYDDCQAFITALNNLTGEHFRLPTEAEWEYAARGGSLNHRYMFSGSNDINEVAWYKDNSGATTHPVATKAANELGIYDMSGNVCEWCGEWFSEYPAEPQTNPTGPETGRSRVHRGGCLQFLEQNCAVTRRNYFSPGIVRSYMGLRLVK